MRILSIIAIAIMAATATARAQSLEECRRLHDAGYWKEAMQAYQKHIASLDSGNSVYYNALSNYAELLHNMDLRAEADTLLSLSARKLAKSISYQQEALLAAQRHSYYSGKSAFRQIGEIKQSLISILKNSDTGIDEIDEIDLDESTENWEALMLRGQQLLAGGLTWLARNKLAHAESVLLKEHSENSLEYAKMLLCWTEYYSATTNYAQMLSVCGQAMEILESQNLSGGVAYADAMSCKALAMSQLGYHQSSLSLHAQALEIYRKAIGENTSRYAKALYNQGISLGIACEIDLMIESEQKASEIYSAAIGSSSPEYAAILNEIGVAYSMRNDTASEFRYYMKSLDINKKFIGEGSYQTASQYYSISAAYSRLGNWDMALEYIRKANRIAITATGLKSVFTADCMVLRGFLNMKAGKQKIAQKMLEGAIAIYESALEPECLKRARAVSILGECLLQQGKYAEASEKISGAARTYQQNLADNFSFMTSPMRNRYWENSAEIFSRITRLCWEMPDDPATLKSAYNCELISKGIKLSSEQEFASIISGSGNESLMRQFEKLQELRQMINSESEIAQDEKPGNTDSLKKAARKLEQQLIAECKEYGDLARPIKVTFRDIQKSLKPGELAVEFVKYQDSDTLSCYGALIARSGSSAPYFVPLFTSGQFYGAFATRMAPYASQKLYNMVWKPMERFMDGISTIYFAPTGLLYSTAIEYAPTGDSSIISDQYKIFRISSTRNLVLDKAKPQTSAIAVYGGIYYNTDTTTMRRESNAYSYRHAGADSFLRSYFSETGGIEAEYLPGTEKESSEIAGTMSKFGYKTILYSKDKANEESFKNLSGSDLQIIHIATHGFFLEDSREQFKGDNSLLLSGLLMSGCNNIMEIPSGIDDGILTAREISYLDFRRTGMVVLSACETALGEITDDGVFGLQRGFKKAGASTIVMSLWPVNDYATKILMTNFYDGIGRGLGRQEAFAAAQKYLRGRKGVDPSHWAAFIMLDGNE